MREWQSRARKRLLLAPLNFPRKLRGLLLAPVLAGVSLMGQEAVPPAPPPQLASPPAAASAAAPPAAPAAAAPAAAAGSREASRFAGQPVHEVRLEGASIDSDARLRQGIAQQPGQPLDANKVRK